MTTRQAPPPRSTIVGLQAAHDEPITPPRGSEELRRGADTSLLLQELHRVESKVDAAHTDIRSYGAITRAHDAVMRGLDAKIDEQDRRLAALTSAVAGMQVAITPVLDVPKLLRDQAQAVRDLQGAVKRLDERLNRTERRGESQSEIVERMALVHVEDETTEVRARSLEMVRKHKLRMAVIKWVAVVLLPLLGAALHRLLGG